MNNQDCKIRPQILNINGDNPLFYLYSIQVFTWSGSCNNINDPYPNYIFLMLLKT